LSFVEDMITEFLCVFMEHSAYTSIVHMSWSVCVCVLFSKCLLK